MKRQILLTMVLSVAMPVSIALADKEAEKAELKRNMDKQVQELQMKINEVREDYKEDGIRVEQKIKEYEDRIAEIKRETDMKLDDKNLAIKDENNRNKADMNAKAEEVDENAEDRFTGIRHEFNEWRLKRAINSYDEKIDDLRVKAEYENDANKKQSLEETVQKLEAKYNAAKAKLNDLRVTDGENWDQIERELDANLKEIDQDYEAAKQYDRT